VGEKVCVLDDFPPFGVSKGIANNLRHYSQRDPMMKCQVCQDIPCDPLLRKMDSLSGKMLPYPQNR
jgi:hypothetical protein